MRARITFNIQEQENLFPHYHQNLLADWIEEIKAKSTKWRDNKSYNFSSLRGQATAQQYGLEYLTSRVRLVISSPSEQFIDFLIEQTFGKETWQLGPLQLAPSQVYQEPLPKLDNAVKYICISPLVPSFAVLKDEEAGKEFIHPRKELFSDLLYDCTMSRMEQSGIYSKQVIKSFFRFQLIPDQSYLNKVKQEGKLFARIYPINYQNKQYDVRAYVLPFTLHADEEVQAYVYTHGFGAFTQQGLGMLDTKHTMTEPPAL